MKKIIINWKFELWKVSSQEQSYRLLMEGLITTKPWNFTLGGQKETLVYVKNRRWLYQLQLLISIFFFFFYLFFYLFFTKITNKPKFNWLKTPNDPKKKGLGITSIHFPPLTDLGNSSMPNTFSVIFRDIHTNLSIFF